MADSSVRSFAALTGSEDDARLREFSRELRLFEFQLSRVETLCSAREREVESYAALQAETEQAIEHALGDIQALKAELQVARVERRQKEEYEVLRRQVMQHPSRALTLDAIASVKSEILTLEEESAASSAHVETRKKAFAELLATIDKLALDVEGEVPDAMHLN